MAASRRVVNRLIAECDLEIEKISWLVIRGYPAEPSEVADWITAFVDWHARKRALIGVLEALD